MKKILAVAVVMLMAASAQAAVLINVTQGSALDTAAGFTDVGSGTSIVGDVTITVGNRTVPGQSNWYNPGTEMYEGYGLDGQSGKFVDLSSTSAMTEVQVNVSWYENDAQYVTYTAGSTTPSFTGSQPWWWSEDGGVSAAWGAGNTTFSLSSNAALFTNAVKVIPEPATMSLLVLGGIATLIRRRNRRA